MMTRLDGAKPVPTISKVAPSSPTTRGLTLEILSASLIVLYVATNSGTRSPTAVLTTFAVPLTEPDQPTNVALTTGATVAESVVPLLTQAAVLLRPTVPAQAGRTCLNG